MTVGGAGMWRMFLFGWVVSLFLILNTTTAVMVPKKGHKESSIWFCYPIKPWKGMIIPKDWIHKQVVGYTFKAMMLLQTTFQRHLFVNRSKFQVQVNTWWMDVSVFNIVFKRYELSRRNNSRSKLMEADTFTNSFPEAPNFSRKLQISDNTWWLFINNFLDYWIIGIF